MALSTTNYRWRIIVLLFLATTINYVDRQALSFVMTDAAFKKTLLNLALRTALTDEHLRQFRILMGLVDSAFKAAYTIGFLLIGWLIDRVGTKKGFSVGSSLAYARCWVLAKPPIFHRLPKQLPNGFPNRNARRLPVF